MAQQEQELQRWPSRPTGTVTVDVPSGVVFRYGAPIQLQMDLADANAMLVAISNEVNRISAQSAVEGNSKC